MATSLPPKGNENSGDELSGELRKAVEAVLHDDPPTDWAEETLASLRQRNVQTAPGRRRHLAAWIAVGIAASIVIVILSIRPWSSDRGTSVVEAPPEAPERPPEKPQTDLVRPTLWAYQQAARQSPETLDALLDQHARELLQPSSEVDLANLWQELL